MRVLITGAAGFIGSALREALYEAGRLNNAEGKAEPIDTLWLADRAPTPASPHAPFATRGLAGDLGDPAFVRELAALQADSVFHLAASLTLDAERDAASAYAVNVEALRGLIDQAIRRPRLVFASSIAVFGGALPDVVDDRMRAAPDTTYGTHKAIAELLLADETRKGRIDGRALRLPIVLIRPGSPTPTVSDRIAALVREPLAGRDAVCGLRADTRLPVASAHAVARALIALHDLPRDALPHGGAMNLPALTVSVADMVAAVGRHGGAAAAARIRHAPDPELQRIVDGWPREFVSCRATGLGLRADASIDEIVARHLADRRADRRADSSADSR
ncbi:NAD-dependent epimerase/dehydratase family protein [Cupriavidus respiraculi]|uniref:D-erythronate dehydrogenase n=1 Tax=Cupriavidus respiraculi TaxID=195930 RepID=A0ABM8WMD3_9BURK|nr:NAD-dependent epimerase/dehydratase family protein [Cupriavidus respiraculi]CAG9168549.1 D-erythronate dehydrogenase [Cupriavidus respiraculi]